MAAPLGAIAAAIAAQQIHKRGLHKDLLGLAGACLLILLVSVPMLVSGSHDPAAADCVPADQVESPTAPKSTSTRSSPGSTPTPSGTSTPKPSTSTSTETHGPPAPSSSSSTEWFPSPAAAAATKDRGAKAAPPSHNEDDPGRGKFELPPPDQADLKDVPHDIAEPKQIPGDIKKMYVREGKRYGIPWTLLAGIGMVESHHGTLPGYKDANQYGAGGLMAWIEEYFYSYAQDDDPGLEGPQHWDQDADQVLVTAYRLSIEGAKKSPEGVKEALFSYNRANWYVALVLKYAQDYGSGTVTAGGGTACDTTAGGDTTVACPSGDATGQLVGLNDGRPWLRPQLVQLGKKLQGMGLDVGEHPDFGGVHPVHGPQSLHDYGLAIDVNGGENDGRFDKLAEQLWKQGFGVQWRAPNHDGHMHVDVGLIGRIFSYGSYVSNPNAGKLSCEPGAKSSTGATNAALARSTAYATAARRWGLAA